MEYLLGGRDEYRTSSRGDLMMLIPLPREALIYGVLGVSFAIVVLGNAIKDRSLAADIKIFGYLLLLVPPLLSFVDPTVMDFTAAMFSILAAAVGAAVTAYVNVYEVKKYGGRNLRTLIDIFALSIYAVFVSPNLVSFVMFWLFAEIVGFFAIVFEVQRRTLAAGLRYLLISMVPADIALIALIAIASMKLGFQAALALPMERLSQILGSLGPALSMILLLGFMAKAAVAPLHFWLPDAHSLAPAPASALLSGVMVKMGIYGIIRVLPAVDPHITPYVILSLASLTVVYGGLQALVQSDIKRLLAYSTIENTSLMVLALALYRITGITTLFIAAMMLALAHGFFKSSLFMNSGIVEIAVHTRELPKLGFLSKFMPSSTVSALVSVLSLLGVPPTMGFLAKLYLFAGLIEVVYMNTGLGIATLIVAAVGAGLAVAYGIRYLTVYWGSLEASHQHVEVPREGLLTKSELSLSLMNVVLAVPLFIAFAVANFVALEPVYLAPFVIVEIAFLVLLYHTYTHTKSVAQEIHWLGGAAP